MGPTLRLRLGPLPLSPAPPGVVTTQLDIVTLDLGLDRVMSAPRPGVPMVPVAWTLTPSISGARAISRADPLPQRLLVAGQQDPVLL